MVRNPFNMLASAHSRPEGPRALADVVRICDRIAQRFRTFADWHRSRRLRELLDRLRGARAREGDVHRLVAALGHTLGPAQQAVIAAEGGGRGSSFRDAEVNERWRRLPAAWARRRAARARPDRDRASAIALPPVSPFWRLAAPVLWRRGGGGSIARRTLAREGPPGVGSAPSRAVHPPEPTEPARDRPRRARGDLGDDLGDDFGRRARPALAAPPPSPQRLTYLLEYHRQRLRGRGPRRRGRKPARVRRGRCAA